MTVKRPKTACGFTLVEVLIAIVILTVVAIGGVAFIYHSQVGLIFQGDKRVALEAANSRLEELRASQYGNITPTGDDYDIHYLSGQIGSWTITDSDPSETKTINGKTLPIVTTVRYMDIDGGFNSYDYIRITVNTGYREAISTTITLDTFCFP